MVEGHPERVEHREEEPVVRDLGGDDMLTKAELVSPRSSRSSREDEGDIIEAVVISPADLIAPEDEGVIEEAPFSFWYRSELVKERGKELRIPEEHPVPVLLLGDIAVPRVGERVSLAGERRLGEGETERVHGA